MEEYKQHLKDSKKSSKKPITILSNKKSPSDKKNPPTPRASEKVKKLKLKSKISKLLEKSLNINQDSCDDKDYLKVEQELKESFQIKKLCIDLDDVEEQEKENKLQSKSLKPIKSTGRFFEHKPFSGKLAQKVNKQKLLLK